MENNSQSKTEIQKVEIDLKAAKAAVITQFFVMFIGFLPLILGVLYLGLPAITQLGGQFVYAISIPLIILGLTIVIVGVIGFRKANKRARGLIEKQRQLQSPTADENKL